MSVQSSEGRAGIQYQLYPSEILRISGGTMFISLSLVDGVYMIGVLDSGWYGLWYISFPVLVS